MNINIISLLRILLDAKDKRQYFECFIRNLNQTAKYIDLLIILYMGTHDRLYHIVLCLCTEGHC